MSKAAIQTAIPLAGGKPVRLITCHANRGKEYRVTADEHGNFLRVDVAVWTRQGQSPHFRTVWDTRGGKDPSTTACCAMRSARRVLDAADQS